MKDIGSALWVSSFRKHVVEYLHMLSIANANSAASMYFYSSRNREFYRDHLYIPDSTVVDVIYFSGMDRLPEGIPAALEFCRTHPAELFTPTVWEWILDHSRNTPPGFRSLTERECHAWFLENDIWKEMQNNQSALRLLSRIQPPSDLTTSERKSAAAVWKTRLVDSRLPDVPETRLPILNQIYLLSDDPEERFRVLQDVLPVLPWDSGKTSLPVWSERIREHCREYPQDEVRFQKHCLERLCYHGVASGQRLGGLFGIFLIGTGHDENWLLDMVQDRFHPETPLSPNQQSEWELLSRWRPDAPAVREKLLDWWYTLDVPTYSPVFSSRWNAIFTLENESRLVALIAGTPPDVHPPVVPSGWLPGCPRLQMQLMETVTDRLEAYLSPAHRASFYPAQEHLWELLFRLPGSGSYLTRFLRSGLTGDHTSLSCIQKLLRSPGLPMETSAEEIREMVDMTITHLKHADAASARKKELSFLTLELVREYLRRGEVSPTAAPVPATGRSSSCSAMSDSLWVSSTLEYVMGREIVRDPKFFLHVSDLMTDAGTGQALPPGSASLLPHLWQVGMNRLADTLASSIDNPCHSPDVESLLKSLCRLTRHMSPAVFAVHGDTDGQARAAVTSRPSGESSCSSLPLPSRLWETLSTLVQRTEHETIFIMAAAIGNWLAPYTDQAQQAEWWKTLCQSSPGLSAVAPELPSSLRQHLLSAHLVSILERTREEMAAHHFADTTVFLRQLRLGMYLFPDHPIPDAGFWDGIWKETFEVWKTETACAGTACTGVGGTALDGGMPRPEFMDVQCLTSSRLPGPDRPGTHGQTPTRTDGVPSAPGAASPGTSQRMLF